MPEHPHPSLDGRGIERTERVERQPAPLGKSSAGT